MSLNISILNIFLPIVILLYNWRVNRNAVFLSLLLFLIATSNIRHALVMHAKDPFWLAVISNNLTPLWTLIGPCLYLYVRGVLTDRFEWKRKDFLHTIPFWINLIGIIPYLFTSFDYKLELADLMIRKLEDYKNIRVNWLLPQPVNLSVRAVLQIAYALACMVMLVRYRLPHTPYSTNRPAKQRGFVYQWLWCLTLFVLMIAAYYLLIVILYYSNPDMGRRMIFEFEMLYIFGGILTFLPFLILFYPSILYGIPKYRPWKNGKAIPEVSPVTERPAATVEPAPTAPSKPIADDERTDENDPFQELGARILAIMEEQQPYRQEDFSPEDLARMLEIPKHHLHYCLRNILNTRFVSLRTTYRMNHAKKLLLQSNLRITTMENIGQECGFSSRSAFYKVFKSEIGCSPGEFIEREKKPKEDGSENPTE